MTKEKLTRKRIRDIALVAVSAALIFVFFLATCLTNGLTEDDAQWSSWLAVLFIILFIASIILTVYFGSELKKDNEKLFLIQDGVPEEEVEEKYKELQELKEKEQEEKQERNKRNRQLKMEARSKGLTYYYDGNGDVHINNPSKKNQTKKSSTISWLDGQPEDHEIFDDPDIDDIVIMDFLDDDEDNLD